MSDDNNNNEENEENEENKENKDEKVIKIEDRRRRGSAALQGSRKKVTLEETKQRAESGGEFTAAAEIYRYMHDMNAKHAFIESFGGKPAVINFIYSEVYKRFSLEFISIESLSQIYSNQIVHDGDGKNNKGKWWLQHIDRRTYKSVIFDPSRSPSIVFGGPTEPPQIVEEGPYFNLWQGFAIKPKKGKWKRMKKHIWKIMCNKDAKKFKYVIRWLAWMIQNPEKRAEVAIIFRGKEGAGKGVLWDQFLAIFGQHAMTVSHPDHFSGKFNSHLSSLVFLFVDEGSFYAGDKEVEGRIKALITQEKVETEAKFRDVMLNINRLHIGMATNKEWVIAADDESTRRFFVNTVSSRYAKGNAPDYVRKIYFTNLWDEMNNGGQEAMLYDLLNHKLLYKWHPRDEIPETEELNIQKVLSLKKESRAVLTFLENGILPGTMIDNRYDMKLINMYDLLKEYEPQVDRIPARLIGSILKELGCTTRKIKGQIHWTVPPLQEIRAEWNKKRVKINWNDKENWSFPTENGNKEEF